MKIQLISSLQLQQLQTLNLLWPATGLVHIGPGINVQNTWYKDWPISSVHWIEADPIRFECLKQQAICGQQVHHALLGEKVLLEATWYQLTNPNESSLLSLSSLASLWPNLQSRGQQNMAQTTLDGLLATSNGSIQTVHEPSPINWLYIDCLPAAYILRGAIQTLAHVAVIVARVTTQVIPTLQGQGASMQELCEMLLPQGFTLLSQQEETNPSYSTVVLVRNYAVLHAQAVQNLKQQRNTQQALEADLASAQKTIEAEMQAKVPLQQKLEYSEKAQAEIQKQMQQSQATNTQLAKEKEQLTQAQQALEANLATAQKTIEAEMQAKVALQQKLEQSEKAHAELQNQLQQSQATTAQLAKEKEQLTQAQQALEANLAELRKATIAEAHTKVALQQKLAHSEQTLAVHQAQLQHLKDEQAQLLQTQEQQTQANKALELDLTHSQNLIAGLQAQIAEQEKRQHQVQAEMERAQTQLTLLENLLSPHDPN